MGQASPDTYFAFSSIRVHPVHGYFGGLLVVNSLARPIEFHCTLPIKPSRAQTILYGPTLDEFLCGEQIVRTLLTKIKSKPTSLFCDNYPSLAARNLFDLPIAVVMDKKEHQSPESDGNQWVIPTLPVERSLQRFQFDGFEIETLTAFPEDHRSLSDLFQSKSPQIDLTEPFCRIVEALLEANPVAKAA
jgi:hypothetical protein